MKAYLFPGQGSQFPGMGRELYEGSPRAKELFEQGNDIIGFRITDIMFSGTEEDLKQTSVTQPAIFLHSVILADSAGEQFEPAMVAGHSLGEFSALVAAGALSFEDGLKLVFARANAMQKACEARPSAMAAVLGLEDKVVEDICAGIAETVVAANYNCPGQLVISGTVEGIEEACRKLTEAGARRAIVLNVGGAFHSPLMEPVREELETAILATAFGKPFCPVYQNITAEAADDPETIRKNLVAQLTGPVRWTQTILHMIAAGANTFIETGPGNILQGLVRKTDRSVTARAI
ncbi:MAG TPA: ACP S-malonyltransferase [Anseongella sp.]|nr:ACP S-malonyltransferase [Anseongella sp.]